MFKTMLFAGVAAGMMVGVSAASAESVASAPQLEEVVVTAQRRTENLQDVPVSITALSAANLKAAGIQNTQDLQFAVPGLVFARSTIGTQPTIRGVGSRSASTGNEGNVAVYLDGAYQAQPYANLFDLNDVEQIEVLKGPQVTLYGRNATGGAINIRTRAPSFTPIGQFSASYGSYQYMKGSAYVSGPLMGDSLAGSLSVAASKDSGYIKNVYLHITQGDSSSFYVRPKILFKPNDKFQIGLNGLYLQSSATDNYSSHTLGGSNVTRPLPNPLNLPDSVLYPTGNYQTATEFEPINKLRAWNANLHSSYDFGFAALSGQVDFRRTSGTSRSDSDFSPKTSLDVEIDPFSRSWYSDLVLTSKSDQRLTWLAGVTGFWDLTETRPQLVRPTTGSQYGVGTHAKSAFAETTFEVVDHLFLTGGLRYSTETKHGFFSPFNIVTGVRSATSQGDAKWNAWTPRLVARYEFSPDTNVYGSFSKGFKSGSFDASSAVGAINPVNPENVKAYEVGVKTRPMSNLSLTGAAFKYDYTNLQVVAITSTATTSSSRLINAAAARIKGSEFAAAFQATNDLKLGATLTYLDARFGSFPNAVLSEPATVGNVFPGGVPSGNGNVNRTEDVTGKQLIRAPKWTYSVNGDYTFREVLGGDLSFSAALFHSSKYWADLNNRVAQAAYTMLDATVTWHAKNGVYVQLQGRNLTNALVSSQIYISGTGDNVAYQKPRNWLATLGYDF